MTGTSADFWWQTLSSPLSLRCAALAVGLILGVVLVTRALLRFRGTRRRFSFAALHRDTGGVATIEFALLVPILLFIILTLAQTTMLMGGNIFVHYAAFAAARTAIVQIPADYADEPANTYLGSPGTAKRQAIFCSAVFALLPVSGSTPGGNSGDAPPVSTDALTQAMTQFYTAYGQTPPPWIAKLLPNRLAYAAANTTLAVLTPVVDGNTVSFNELTGVVNPADPITVRVTHNLNLGVPYVNRIFADGSNGGTQRYTTLTADSTLSNQGITDHLPPPPSLPRLP